MSVVSLKALNVKQTENTIKGAPENMISFIIYMNRLIVPVIEAGTKENLASSLLADINKETENGHERGWQKQEN